MNLKIKQLIISKGFILTAALQQMDKVGFKLLIVGDSETMTYEGLVTIGDIQRAIISNMPLDTPIGNIIRSDLLISSERDELLKIKSEMLNYRLAYMPVINADNKIVNVIFWEDIIKIGNPIDELRPQLGLPVVIMAGGFGTRLKPLTNIFPKPLLPFGDKTIIENIIDRFLMYGCNEFDISVNYKGNLIEFYLNNIEGREYSLSFFSEDQPLGTAGSLRLLKHKLKTTFFVSNCDILVDDDYAEIYKYHKNLKNELTLIASVKNYNIPYGTIESGENGELVKLKEKPDMNFMVNCGMYILEPHLLEEIPEHSFFHITDLIEVIKKRNGKVGVFPISEKSWTDIGEWDLYSKILFK